MKTKLLFLFMFFSIILSAQVTEVCNDQLDNDLDYLTDCADPDCEGGNCANAFPCQSTSELFQYFNGALRLWDGQNWNAIAGWSNPSNFDLNAMGYNILDGYIYGIERGNRRIVRVTRTGIELYGSLQIPEDRNWHTGDMDLNGNLYISGTNETRMWVVNIADPSQIPVSVNFTGVPGSTLDCADWTYLPATNKLYGIRGNSSILRVMNLDGSHDQDITLTNMNCNNLTGAMFADASGNLYAFCNTGAFYQLSPNVDFTDFTVTQIANNNLNATGNDGAGCPLANGLSDECDCCEEVLRILREMQEGGSNPTTPKMKVPDKPLVEEKTQEKEKARLFQNTPNPFDENTMITYEILSDKVESASIFIFDMNGNMKNNFEVDPSTDGVLEISASTFPPGLYLYSLVVDGEIVDTKKMLILSN